MSTPTNALFICTAKISRATNPEMPAHLKGAFVDCYVAAADHRTAVRRAVELLGDQGFVFEELLDGKVHQLDPLQWDKYISDRWADIPRDHFPDQPQLLEIVAAGGIFFGPYISWERDSD